MTATTLEARGLNYAESTLAAGGLEAGMLAGLAGDRAALSEARRAYGAFRGARGLAPRAARMLTRPDAQAKLGKSERYALGLMLTPADTLNVAQFLPGFRPVNVCPRASAGCRAACLSLSGRGAFTSVQFFRQVRHAFLLSEPFHAGVIIGAEIRAARADKGPDAVTFRFNTVSDSRIEFIMPRALEALEAMGVRCYDYTAWSPADRRPGPGLSLTYSAKESAHTSDAYLADVLRSGENVAMPFHGSSLPASYRLDDQDFMVIDGDRSDDRTEDPRGATGVIVGLTAKGANGKADTSGFIRTANA